MNDQIQEEELQIQQTCELMLCSQTIGAIQIKMRYHFQLSDWQKFKRSVTLSMNKNMGKVNTFTHCCEVWGEFNISAGQFGRIDENSKYT